MADFIHQGQRISFADLPGALPARGNGKAGAPTASARPIILIHGLLLSREMHMHLARRLAARGNRAIAVDLLGHGESQRPTDADKYSMTSFARQALALMDHLEIDRCALLGTSLGANTALELARLAPQRVSALIAEMPVLDDGVLGCALVFAPLLAALTLAAPAMRVLSRAAAVVPRRPLPTYGQMAVAALRRDPDVGAAILRGLFRERVAPPRQRWAQLQMPTLVIGHRHDPMHPLSDAIALAAAVPGAELAQASWLADLRLHPQRLTGIVADLLDSAWAGPVSESPGRLDCPAS